MIASRKVIITGFQPHSSPRFRRLQAALKILRLPGNLFLTTTSLPSLRFP